MKLYDHERHPLDIAAEEEAKDRAKIEKKIDASLTFQSSRPLEDLSINVLQYEVALHLGHEYMYLSNKHRKAKNWPTTFPECVEFLREKGLKR